MNEFQIYVDKDAIESTPTFIINGKKYANRSYDELKKIIEKELNSNLKLDLSNIKYNTSLNNYNDFGFQLYQGNLDYIGNFKFSSYSQVVPSCTVIVKLDK